MIVSDYDYTFYINDDDIKNNIKLSSLFMKDNIFIIATGRSFLDYENKRKMYDIKTNYVILDHGATILKDNKIIYNEEINNIKKNELLKDLKLELVVSSFGCNGFESRLDLFDNVLTKINVKYPSSDIAKEIHDSINKKYADYIQAFLVSKSLSIEIVSKKVNKSKAIKYIAKLEGIREDDIYTIGDSYNDIQMIKDFNGYAIGHAIDELKECAKGKFDSVSKLIELVMTDK